MWEVDKGKGGSGEDTGGDVLGIWLGNSINMESEDFGEGPKQKSVVFCLEFPVKVS